MIDKGSPTRGDRSGKVRDEWSGDGILCFGRPFTFTFHSFVVRCEMSLCRPINPRAIQKKVDWTLEVSW